jgi:hypothetical protein
VRRSASEPSDCRPSSQPRGAGDVNAETVWGVVNTAGEGVNGEGVGLNVTCAGMNEGDGVGTGLTEVDSTGLVGFGEGVEATKGGSVEDRLS